MKKHLHYKILLLILMLRTLIGSAQYQYVGTYNENGKPNNLTTVSDKISNNFKTDLNATIPENYSVPVYNPKLLADNRFETIALTASSDVWISFLDADNSGNHALGYYTYPTNAPLQIAPENAAIKIIFPNAAKANNGGSLVAGDKVWLGKFPANTSIAFVLVVNGWEQANNLVGLGSWKIFSNSAFNPESDTDLKKHFVSIHDTTSGRIIFGFETKRRDVGNNSDHDFNDAIFYASISPIENVAQLASFPVLAKDGKIAGSGNNGGLESKSLGDVIAKRVYQKAVNSLQAPIDYSKLTQISNNPIQKTVAGVSNISIQLKDIVPTKIFDSTYTGYISTAADLTTITNAVDVVSLDFTINNECRAAVFATKTLNQMYDHTKSVCDRLKGASLLGMEYFPYKGLNLVRYTLLQPTGNIEYAMSFSIGMRLGRTSFSFQSNWLNKDYTSEDVLYNVQVWSATPVLSVQIAQAIINKLNSIMPVQTLYQNAELPKAYIESGKRDGKNINFKIQNNSTSTIGYFLIEDKQVENSIQTTSRKVPVIMTANGNSTTSITVNDAYESSISLYLNNTLQDVVFMADGSWNIDYNKNTTVVNQFSISNDSINKNNTSSEILPVMRNVTLKATTNDQFTVYKLLKGGAAVQDLTGFNSIKFKASAVATNLKITLIKNSISNWNEQFSYTLPISGNNKDYSVNLNDFTTIQNAKAFNPNDITTIVFTFQAENGKATDIAVAISNIEFTKQNSAATVYKLIETKNVKLYPNPAKGRFVASFNAQYPSTVTLKMLDAHTGRQIISKEITTVSGENNIPVELNQSINTNVYILKIEGTIDSYQPKTLIVQQ